MTDDRPVDAADAARDRRPRRIDAGLDGILVVDKPVGPTSHDVVALVRRLAGTKRIGHGGTLDPFASGVLPLYLGLGTRVVEFHLGARKAYRATVCFGASSTTDDLEGELTPSNGPAPSRGAVEAALAGFLGTHLQLPPAFSARKVGGRRAYALARAGHAPELPAREATFHALDPGALGRDGPGRTARGDRRGVFRGHLRPGAGARSRGGRRQRRVSRGAPPHCRRPVHA